jgi:chloramphenicol O-acetyltransferase type A
MSRYLDVERWPRRAAFEFFRGYAHPYFNICAPLDATALLARTRAGGDSFSIACLYLATRTANEYEPFRYRLEGDRVRVHDRIHAGTTVLVEDEALAFIYADYTADFPTFQAAVRAAARAVQGHTHRMEAQDERTDLIHFSTLPWVSFTSVSNARRGGGADSVPKIIFGRYEATADRVRLPISVEVHHALMDGVHVARYLERLQEAFAAPAHALAG